MLYCTKSLLEFKQIPRKLCKFGQQIERKKGAKSNPLNKML